jgi:ubiquinone/menaquinone biosynthesis C-methylase UbiE
MDPKTAPTGLFDRLYAMAGALRVGWYTGQYALARRLGGRQRLRTRSDARYPSEAELRADLRALFASDARNVAAGLYPMPPDLLPSPSRAVTEAVAFLSDVPGVAARRRARLAGAQPERLTSEGHLPRYYRQSFHDQTDGYLSARSARLYDHQVEVLFGGAADAMRRQVLVPVAAHLDKTGVRGAALLDVGCGTGAMSVQLKRAFPRARLIACDLSLPYLVYARSRLARWTRTQLVRAQAERLPVATGAIDAALLVFLLHELPRAVRDAVVAELARVVKRGGVVVLLDTLQTGDHPPYDALLELFPVAFYEPYYADYVLQDLNALFAAHGFERVDEVRVFLAKRSVFRRL